MRVEFAAAMWRKPGQAPMEASTVQYNVLGRPARLFLTHARMFGLPVRALHIYRHEQATFQVRVASLVDIVHQQGEQISAAETVTVLNDLCFMAPSALVDPRLAWRPIDDRTALVTFTNGPHSVTATLVFNEDDELVDFVSDDRPDSSAGTFIARTLEHADLGLPGGRWTSAPHAGQRRLRPAGRSLHLRHVPAQVHRVRRRRARRRSGTRTHVRLRP